MAGGWCAAALGLGVEPLDSLLGAVLMALAALPDWAVMVATSRKKIRLGPIFVRPE